MKKTIKEGSMSDIDVMAKEAKTFKEFVNEFYKEFKDFPKNTDAMKWLEGMYKSVSESTDSDDLERVADGLPQTVEEMISEITLTSAGVKNFLRALYRNTNLIKKMGFSNFKSVVDYIKNSDIQDWDELRDEAEGFGLKFESINEASYDFGKKQYTDKNMTPVEILDLAMAYSKTPIMKLVGNKHEFRIRSANDLAKLTGTTQSDVKVRGKQPALILFLLKNKLVSKDEYTKLYKDLLTKQIEVIRYLKNSSPEMRGAAGAARAAAKDMKGEFEESVTEGDEKTPDEILMGLKDMAMGNLERIADYANMIETRMSEGQELSSWMYSQITIALENLNAVHDAMDGNDDVREPMKEEKPGLWANIRAKKARGGKPAHGNSDAHKDAVKAGKKINKEEVDNGGKVKSEKNYKDWKGTNSTSVNEDENPCWKGYEMVGMKMKDGKEVPNCVPKNESVTEETKRDYKAEYKKFQSSTESKKYRAELNKYNRDKGTYGNGDGKDASHKNGKIVGFEAESVNRGRAEKSRLKKESTNIDAGCGCGCGCGGSK